MSTLSQFVGSTANLDVAVSTRAEPSSQMTGIVKSIQYVTSGAIASGASSADVTISAVVVAKTIIFMNGFTFNTSYTNIGEMMLKAKLTSTTNVQISRFNAPSIASGIAEIVVVEYY